MGRAVTKLVVSVRLRVKAAKPRTAVEPTPPPPPTNQRPNLGLLMLGVLFNSRSFADSKARRVVMAGNTDKSFSQYGKTRGRVQPSSLVDRLQ